MLTEYPHSRAALFIALGLHVLQAIWYYPRLPERMACKFDLARNPSRWCGKAGYCAVTLTVMIVLCGFALAAPALLTWLVAGVLLFIAAVNQYVFTANVGDGALHPSFFTFLAVSILLFILGIFRIAAVAPH